MPMRRIKKSVDKRMSESFSAQEAQCALLLEKSLIILTRHCAQLGTDVNQHLPLSEADEIEF